MKRPLLVVAISYIVGIIIGVYLKIGIPFILLLLLMLSIIKRKNWKMFIIIAVTIIISSIHVIYLNSKYQKIYEYSKYENVKLVGTVYSQIEETDYKYIIHVKLDRNIKLILQLEKDEKELKKLAYGNKIIFNGKYEEPADRKNYKGFSYKEYLKTEGIYGIVKVENKIQVIKSKNVSLLQLGINNLSIKIKQNLEKILPEKTVGLAEGILLGDSSELGEGLKENFRDCNLSHMLAVSGIHLSYLIVCLNFVLNKRKFGIRNCKIISIVVIIIFMLITNMSPSVVRAGISAIIGILGTLIYRKQDTYTTIAFACLLTLIKNPFSLLNIGMQLSYLATLGIVTFYPLLSKIKIPEEKIKNYIIENTLVTISANILILPITIYNFNTIPTNFLLSNLIAGPVLGISLIFELITVFASFISINLAKIPGFIVNVCLALLTKITEIISKIPNITVVTPKILCVILVYIIILNICLYINNKEIFKNYKISKVLFILISITLITNSINIESGMIFYFIDVGQGDSTLICTPTGKNVLIDGGGSRTPDKYDVGEKVLLPYLLDRRIKKLDYIIISHFDADHAQGIEAVIKKIKVENIVVSKQASQSVEYDKIIKMCKEKKIKIIDAKRGEKIVIDKYAYFDILHPGDILLDDGKGGLNANAIVAKLNYKMDNKLFTALFTGDIEYDAEQELVKEYGNKLKADILKVAHHGSKTSSSQNFIELVKPKIALIGVGKDNTFGHPNESVLERLRDLKCKIYRTDENGEISIKVKREGRLKLECCVK
ncbi:MAG: DNA internalization-related competence protein ComEC/Rec2 [Clostridia bacterium]